MALDGPISLEQLIALTGGKKRGRGLMPGRGEGEPARPAPRGMVRLLGIDPGTRLVGWGVIEHDAQRGTLRLADCGCIRPGRNLSLRFRLSVIFDGLEEAIRRTRPDAAALEETFAGVNMQSAIAMGEGRGIALLCLARAGIEVLELSPRSIKQAVTGSGAAGKDRVAAMVAAQLGLKKPPRPADITDALAAAIALSRRR